jgi:hypothetical protein
MTAPLAPVPGLVAYLATLAGPESQREGYLELRHRRPGCAMRQRFFDALAPNGAGVTVRVLSASGDVFVGCAPRARRGGAKDAIDRAWVLWADCDSDEAGDRLAEFDPQPTMLVRSGRGLHAYFALDAPLEPFGLERANRRLAHALGADAACADAARVLRPPLTLNYKYDPPAPVRLIRFTGSRVTARAVVGGLAEPPLLAPIRRPRPTREDADPLLRIDPAVYVAALTGQRVGRDRKVTCPFHPDRTPSLHAYADPADGWFCFGRCGRGGSIYDLAAPLLGYDTSGADFISLRAELSARFGIRGSE